MKRHINAAYVTTVSHVLVNSYSISKLTMEISSIHASIVINLFLANLVIESTLRHIWRKIYSNVANVISLSQFFHYFVLTKFRENVLVFFQTIYSMTNIEIEEEKLYGIL